MAELRRVLILGSDQVWSIERIFIRYIIESGIEAKIFACQNLFHDYYYASVWNKARYRLGISVILDKINVAIIKAVDDFDPQVIWVFKGMEVYPRTLEKLKAEGRVIVNYNPDNPFVFSGRGSGNANVAGSIGIYHFHFTYNLEIKRRLERDWGLKTYFLPFGFDCEEEIIAQVQEQEEVHRVCFLGNPDKERAHWVSEISKRGVPIDVYGNNWTKFLKKGTVQFFEPVYEKELWQILNKYRVQLNLMRKHNENSHNMRSFEIPGIGGIQLAPDTVEHRLFFTKDSEIFLYESVEECCLQAKKLLSLNSKEARLIRQRARMRSLESGYTYRDRTNQAIKYMEELLNG